MTVTKNKNGDSLVVSVEGRLDTTTAPTLEKELDSAYGETSDLVLDFEKLEYVSSAGLRVLLKAQKTMNAKKGRMVLHNVCDEIMEVLDITGFSDILTIE